MANEYLQRTVTSTGNRRVFTWAGWLKISNTGTLRLLSPGGSGNQGYLGFVSNGIYFIDYDGSTYWSFNANQLNRDVASWMHLLVSVDTTQEIDKERVRLYLNGTRITKFSIETYPTKNYSSYYNASAHYIGRRGYDLNDTFDGELADLFFIDGQALTPDVFGFYKEGKGYISAGSTQATDFRPGQWVPKTPRIIKAEIERNGGFGVNGFYLPMNDSNNFGADFHTTPNSIIKLQEDLPQPKVSIASTAQAGLAYTDVLRADPYAANLVLALPFVSGGLESGLGDYSHLVRNTGIAKTITVRGNVSTVSVASSVQNYYGSSATWDGSGDCLEFTNDADFRVGSGDFTIEGWFRTRTAGTQETYFALFGDSSSRRGILLYKDTSNVPRLELSSGTNSAGTLINIQPSTSVVLGDWHHIAVERHEDTASIYLNGVAIGIATNVNSVPGSIYNNTTDPFQVGAYGGTNVQSFPWNGQISDLRFYKGVAKYKGGFDVPKPYTPVGISTWRAVPDCTANNFATWNPLDAKDSSKLSNGNLSTGIFSANKGIRATVGVSTGKWYWEWREENATPNNHHGIWAVNSEMSTYYVGQTADSWGIYAPNGNKRNNTSFDAYGSAFSQGDIIMCALDKTNGKIWWGKNGTWFASGNPATGSNEAFSNVNTVDVVAPTQIQYEECSYNFGQNPTFSGNTTAGTFTDSNGKGLFKYQPPSGFLALCEDNLPTPAISDPGEYFKTVLWTGDGASGRSITGIGFTPDLVWIKRRVVGVSNNLADSVRGPGVVLFSDATNADYPGTDRITSFNSDGFSIGNNSAINNNGDGFVAWCWRAGAGTTSANTDGSINSVVSVNQDAGFSIISWNGSGAQGSIGHGLGKTPAMIVIKNRSDAAGAWQTWHQSFGTGSTVNRVYFNSTVGQDFSSTNIFKPNSDNSTILLNTGDIYFNRSPDKYIAYCWAEIEGFSKAFSYVGNNSADGPFVYCGFKPAWVMYKRTDTTGDWAICDSSRNSINPLTLRLFANNSNGDTTGVDPFDFVSNGFKFRTDAGSANASGGTYIGIAFAESPFQTANSK